MYDFSGKIVVVTGASKGIGEAIAARFLKEGAEGVAMLARNGAALSETAKKLDPDGERTLALSCDVADSASVEAAFRIIAERFGRVDILINNAGLTRDAMSYRMTEEQFDAVVKVSLYGSFHCVSQVAKGMRERGFGRIISISSLAYRGNPGQLNYSSAKAGLLGMTRTLAMELAAKGVTANAIVPGMINTDIIATVPEKIQEAMLAQIPARRFGEPEEVASLAVFLASEEAAYINGQCINITGGWH